MNRIVDRFAQHTRAGKKGFVVYIGAGDLNLDATRQLPITIGFGVSTPGQVKAVAGHGDAVVVGSAIVNQIAEHGKSPELVPCVAALMPEMVDAVKAG